MAKCPECGNPMSSANVGNICFACQEKKRDEIAKGAGRYYNIKDMKDILQLDSEEQVRRKARNNQLPGRIPGVRRLLFEKQTVDEWIRNEGRIISKPTNPLQEQAHALCQKGDHSWMFEDKYYGHAYLEGDERVAIPWTVPWGRKRTCYFCGHIEYNPIC